MAKHKIALIPGDGIGKEVLPEGVRVLEAAARRFNFQLEFTDFDWSCDRLLQTGKMMPDDGMQMEEGLDTGPMLAIERVAIQATDTTASLHDTLAALGADMPS